MAELQEAVRAKSAEAKRSELIKELAASRAEVVPSPKGPSSPDLWLLVPKMDPKSYNREYLDP